MHGASLTEVREDLESRKYSAIELVQDLYQRIEQVDGQVQAYLHLTKEKALEQAAEADRKRLLGEHAPLLGIPLAVKDNICTTAQPSTCASRILESFVSPYNATVINKLEAAGAILLGKTNLDEFAMGSTTENSHRFVTRNPWDLERVPGGSSGGSAAAVAADECIAALGSDTGGSIRQPANFCGVTGLKPTYGRVSRFGLVAFASSFDQIGPMTKTVADSAQMLNVIAGRDPLDSTSADVVLPDYTQSLDASLKGKKMGIPKEYFAGGIDPDVEECLQKAIEQIQSLGVEMVEISLPHTRYAIATYYILACAEASTNLSRYDGVKYGYRTPDPEGLMDMYQMTREEGFGEEVKRRIILGTFVLSSGYYDAYYLKGQKVRTLIKRDFEQAFEQCDFLVTPITPTPAFKLGEKLNDPLQMYLADIYTISANLAGIPALSVPCGLSRNGLPVGMQLMGKHFDEATLLNVGHQFQLHTNHHQRKPALN